MFNLQNIVLKLRSILGVTPQEFIFVSILVSGLLFGSAFRLFQNGNDSLNSAKNKQELYRLIDSIAKIDETTYSGVTPASEAVFELAKEDTLVKNNSFYGVKKAKILTEKTLDLNLANKENLMKLPGVGASTADKIIEFRSKKRFERIEDLLRIKGIGKAKFKKMEQFIIVSR